MKHIIRREHTMDSLFSFVLFGLFVLMLMLMLLFSSKAYQASVRGLDENNNLRTSMAYLTTKIRQHNEQGSLSIVDFQGMEALSLRDTISGKEYITYIYLDGEDLKELFTASSASPSPFMGTTIASLELFHLEETPDHIWRIHLIDTAGNEGSLLLHPLGPAT